MPSELLEGSLVPGRPLFAQISLRGPWGIRDRVRVFSARMAQTQERQKPGSRGIAGTADSCAKSCRPFQRAETGVIKSASVPASVCLRSLHRRR